MKNWQKTISLYIVSQLITQFGTALVSYAITWYITLNTQSGLMMTLAIIFSFLPTFLSNCHKVDEEKDYLAYIARLQKVPVAFDQLLERACAVFDGLLASFRSNGSTA